eukprot:GGOE01037439.1.p1 GENE.GGOE01037439.1~~GGOE01037439.1.p1  ORF type:complete len:128 (+),score=20.33 GGOE01037439.1:43-426(+)
MDEVLRLEEALLNRGRQEGRAKVSRDYEFSGYVDGLQEGLDAGRRLGFIEAYVAVCAQRMATDAHCLPTRAVQAIASMQSLLQTADLLADPPEGNAQLAALEAKLKVLQMALGDRGPPSSPSPSLDF